jgi:FKBP-type peptidyl-prolyl cis-trans isomerase SlyD
MEISTNKMVTLTYDLRFDNPKGELIEQATHENPLQFLFGAGLMLPEFESQLSGMEEGSDFQISLTKKNAYGEVNQDAIVELPKHIFLVDGKFDEELIREGKTVPMMGSNGQRLNGVVLDVKEDTVTMDFNHPLAGEDLFFNGKILEVRDATNKEINQIRNESECSGCTGSCTDGECHEDL